MKSMISHSKAVVLAASDNLSNRLIKQIEDLGCVTRVYSKHPGNWTKDDKLITHNKLITSKYDYLFVLDLDADRFTYLNVCKKLLSAKSYKKIIILLPYSQTPNKAFQTNMFLEEFKNQNIKVIFVGNMLSEETPHYDSKFLNNGRYLLSNISQEMYFSDTVGLVKFVIEHTFSFSTRDNTAYVSEPFRTSELIKKFEESGITNYLCRELLIAKVNEIHKSNVSEAMLVNFVKESNTVSANPNTTNTSSETVDKIVRPKVLIENKLVKKSLKYAITLFIVFVVLPVMLFTLSFVFTRFNLRYQDNNENTIKYARLAGSRISRINRAVFEVYGTIPVVGNFVNNIYRGSLLFESVNNIYAKGSNTKRLVEALTSSVLGNSVKDPKLILSSLESELDLKYSSLEYLKGDIKSTASDYGLSDADLNYLLSMDSKKVLETREFLSNLHSLLGEESQTDYFIVVQNEDNLNSGGGEIVASAYLSFDKGRLSNFVTYSVDEIQQNTKGERGTPNALEVGGGKSRFSNANTDVDVNKNAENILWYLDNSLDIHPEGIVFINQKVLAQVLDIEDGNTKDARPDFDYASILNEAFDSLKNDDTQTPKVLNVLAAGLRNKDVIVWFTDHKVQGQFTSLGYSGDEITKTCIKCNGQTISVLETRISGDAYSSDLGRAAEVEVSFQEQVVKTKLRFEYDLPSGLGQEIYFQLVTDKDASFAPVKIMIDETNSLVKPTTYSTNSYKVAGVPVKLEKNTVVEISWESPHSKTETTDTYLLKWVGQSGVESYPVSFTINGESVDDLTNHTNRRYNTDSSSNIELELEEQWTK